MTRRKPAPPPSYQPGDLLTEAEASAVTRMPRATLRYWRSRRQGPQWIKLEGRIRYPRSELDAWIAHQRELTPEVRS